MVDIETRTRSLFNKIVRSDRLIGVFRVKTDKGYSYRTAAYVVNLEDGEKDLFLHAMQRSVTYLVGVYNKHVPFEWLAEDLRYAEMDPTKR
jgi:hypothetical protein